MPYFVNPKLNYQFQGPGKKFPPVSGFELLSKTGNAYEARKNDPDGKWKKQAYQQIQEPTTFQQVEALDNAVTANWSDLGTNIIKSLCRGQAA